MVGEISGGCKNDILCVVMEHIQSQRKLKEDESKEKERPKRIKKAKIVMGRREKGGG